MQPLVCRCPCSCNTVIGTLAPRGAIVIQPVVIEAFHALDILEPYLVATVDQILPWCRIVANVAHSDLPPT
jgi:hypothetical protein